MLKNYFLPNKENKFLPKIIGCRALILYAFVSVLVFVLISPDLLNLDKFLASLTQELIIDEVNPVREEKGYAKVTSSEKLSLAAQMKAEDMLQRQYFDHTGPDGERPWSWLKKVDYKYAAAAENLAMNASNPKTLVKAWLNSDPHAKNILNGYFNEIGVGIATGEMNGKTTTVVVMFLGRQVPKNVELASSVIESSNVRKPEPLIEIAIASPEEPVLIKTVPEEILYKDNIIEANKKPSQEASYQRAEAKLYLLSEFPLQARIALTGLFNFVLIWGIATHSIL